MKRLPRMRDVAKLAGVSAMTVSRVLREDPKVSEQTRTQVFAATKELGYQLNESARSFRDNRTRQIGLLVPYLLDHFFAICAHSVNVVAKQHGYSVVISTTNDDPQTEFDEALRMVRRNVEGLIVVPAPTSRSKSRLTDDAFEHLPIAAIDRPLQEARFRSVVVANKAGAQLGTEHLIRLGQRRIAYLGLSDEFYTMRARQAGYIASMQAAALKPDVSVLSGSLDDAVGAVRKLMFRSKAPTALFCANNLVTQYVLHGLVQLKLDAPQNVALVGFDDFEAADLLGITVIRQPVEQIGIVAAELLLAELAHEINLASRKKMTVLPVELVVRRSCGSPQNVSDSKLQT